MTVGNPNEHLSEHVSPDMRKLQFDDWIFRQFLWKRYDTKKFTQKRHIFGISSIRQNESVCPKMHVLHCSFWKQMIPKVDLKILSIVFGALSILLVVWYAHCMQYHYISHCLTTAYVVTNHNLLSLRMDNTLQQSI